MWELNNGSYYKWDGDKLHASLINHGDDDGLHPNTYGCQIHPADGGLIAIGYIPHSLFDHVRAEAICDSALRENKPYAWWVENHAQWWTEEVEPLI